MSYTPDIRIGTMADGKQADRAGYIRQILPHGFESIQISFWQTLGGANLKELAPRVREALGDQAVVSSLAVFGNPLEGEETDLETLRAWEAAIDDAPLSARTLSPDLRGGLRGKPIPDSLAPFQGSVRAAGKAGRG